MNINDIQTTAPMIGCDISHWNYPFSMSFGDFQIHKATEGVNYKDPEFSSWTIDCRTMFLGAYHFASKNFYKQCEAEAKNFCKVLANASFKGIAILDLEGDALEQCVSNPGIGLAFLNTVEDITGVKPFLYTNTSGSNRLSIEYAKYPLWIASYNKQTPAINKNFLTMQTQLFKKDFFIWQFCSKPFDMDIANMLPAEWAARSVKPKV